MNIFYKNIFFLNLTLKLLIVKNKNRNTIGVGGVQAREGSDLQLQ